MKLDDFLKCKKVRCVYGDNRKYLTNGKLYDVTGAACGRLMIHNDNGDNLWYDMNCFEPVLDSAENPLQDMKLTPEFESAETVLVYNCEVNTQDNSVNTQDNSVNIQDTPKFRVGDPVYCPLQTKELCKVFSNDQEFQLQCPLTITEVRSRHSGVSGAVVACVDDYGYSDEYDNAPFIFHATPENHALLSKLYPHIDFEQPPKPLTGSDLCRAMLEKGWNCVPCYISDESDYDADNNAFCALIGKFDKCFKELATNYEHEYAVPFDPRTGEPLTEAVLDE